MNRYNFERLCAALSHLGFSRARMWKKARKFYYMLNSWVIPGPMRPVTYVLVFCSNPLEPPFLQSRTENSFRCNAKLAVLQCKSRTFDRPLQGKSKNYSISG